MLADGTRPPGCRRALFLEAPFEKAGLICCSQLGLRLIAASRSRPISWFKGGRGVDGRKRKSPISVAVGQAAASGERDCVRRPDSLSDRAGEGEADSLGCPQARRIERHRAREQRRRGGVA